MRSTSKTHCTVHALQNPILIHPLLPFSLPVLTPNTIHHSRLTICLSESDPLPIDFCFGQAPLNKLVPATSLLWAL